VIEDAPYGVQAAHGGGMQAIAVAGTYPTEQLHDAEFLVRNVGEIRAVFDGNVVTLRCESDLP
jgi:beta-phosphoglucomutase-like phosphatase (HAD superfamily)